MHSSRDINLIGFDELCDVSWNFATFGSQETQALNHAIPKAAIGLNFAAI